MAVTILLVLSLLLWIFVQDIVSRKIYWILFPALAVLYVLIHILLKQPFNEWGQATLTNFVFIGFQFVPVWAYFSLKYKRFVRLTMALIGWGEFLFFGSLAFYLSLLNFIVFYVGSITIILMIALLCGFAGTRKKIPLVGLQALLFAVFLACNCLFFHYNVMNDDKVLEYLIIWN